MFTIDWPSPEQIFRPLRDEMFLIPRTHKQVGRSQTVGTHDYVPLVGPRLPWAQFPHARYVRFQANTTNPHDGLFFVTQFVFWMHMLHVNHSSAHSEVHGFYHKSLIFGLKFWSHLFSL